MCIVANDNPNSNVQPDCHWLYLSMAITVTQLVLLLFCSLLLLSLTKLIDGFFFFSRFYYPYYYRYYSYPYFYNRWPYWHYGPNYYFPYTYPLTYYNAYQHGGWYGRWVANDDQRWSTKLNESSRIQSVKPQMIWVKSSDGLSFLVLLI